MPTHTTQTSALPPNFAGRPDHLELEHMTEVRGYGKILLRPIRPDDEAEMVGFHSKISDESIYCRYFEYLGFDRRTAPERLIRICTNTPESYAIVAEQVATAQHPAAILGVGRLTTTAQAGLASYDLLTIDEAEETKLSSELLSRLVKLARAFGFKTLTSERLVADHDGLNLARGIGFTVHTLPEGGVAEVTLAL